MKIGKLIFAGCLLAGMLLSATLGEVKRASADRSENSTQSLSIDQRLARHRAIDALVSERHGSGKAVSLPSDAFLKAQIEDYLRKSNALALHGQDPVTGADLQAEFDRLSADPDYRGRLRTATDAFKDDPTTVFECVIRPMLVERLIRERYAADRSVLDEIRPTVERERKLIDSPAEMTAMSGVYVETRWVKAGGSTEPENTAPTPVREPDMRKRFVGRVVQADEWDAVLTTELTKLRRDFDAVRVPVGRLSALDEDENGLYVTALLENTDTELRIAQVRWNKPPFDEWWRRNGGRYSTEIDQPIFEYRTDFKAVPAELAAAKTTEPTSAEPRTSGFQPLALRSGNNFWAQGLPTEMLDKLRQEASKNIGTTALRSTGGWAFAFDQELAWWVQGIPDAMLTGLRSQDGPYNVFAFTPSNGWIYVYKRNGFNSSGLLNDMLTRLREVNTANQSIDSISFTLGTGWVFTFAGGTGFWAGSIPTAMFDDMRAKITSFPIVSTGFSSSGGWLFVYGTNGYNSSAAPSAMLEKLREVNQAVKAIGSVAFGPTSNWVFIFQDTPINASFTMTISPSSQTVQPGGTANYSLTVERSSGFTAGITVSAEDLPPGTTFSFTGGPSPNPFRLTTSESTPPGAYTFTVRGIGGGLNNTTTATLVVESPAGFSMAVSPTTQTVQQGGTANYSLTVSRVGGFSSTVNVSAQGLPSGTLFDITSGPSPNPFRLVTSASTPPGSYLVTLTGVGAGLTRTATATLVVEAKGDTEPPNVNVLFPRAGDSFTAGGRLTIGWIAADNDAVTTQSIDLSTDGGTTFTVPVASGLGASTSSFDYLIPTSLSASSARVRVAARDRNGNEGRGVSGIFSIRILDTTPPTVRVIAPGGGGKIKRGSSFLVEWLSQDSSVLAGHDVLLSTDGGATYQFTLATGLSGTAQSASVTFSTSLPTSKAARIRVVAKDAAGNAGQGDSGSFKLK